METTPPISYETWQSVDVRVGRILNASNPDWSNKLIELLVDFGPLGNKTIFTGMRKWYEPEELQGKQALFLVNLPPRKMGDHMSEGMILAADPYIEEFLEHSPDTVESVEVAMASKPAIFLFDDITPPGSRVA